MKILVLGGDGYLGWPTALHLSQAGHHVAVADSWSGPAQMVRTSSVVANAEMAATVKRPKRMPSVLRAFRVSVSPSLLDVSAMDVLG